MAKRKKSGGGGANWMDTYGDMVTLLLCFFVLLYSMSTISEEKWKAIIQSFNPNAIQTATDPSGVGGPFADPDVGDKNPGLNDSASAQEKIDTVFEELLSAIQQVTKEEGIENAVSVTSEGGKIYLKFADSVFFGGNSATLRQDGIEILAHLCTVFDQAGDAIEEIRVQGHTAQQYDNRPNETAGDRRLASDRATNVVIFLQDNSHIHPARLVAEGYGQWHAITDNQGEANKAPNRRVEMEISAKELGSELNEQISTYISKTAGEQEPAASQNP